MLFVWSRNRGRRTAVNWATIQSIATKIGCSPETLRTWVKKAKGNKPGAGACDRVEDRERIKQLERETKDLKRVNEILRLASAFFAQAKRAPQGHLVAEKVRDQRRPPKKW